ncbi:heterokaryon incompatibility protein-domain-containing protein [Exophiala viscosa]|uniref:heterokaryon incompatibility protein-domain-containing protein n=1 Tax=Exophiala viscosa TaxID=2486360 RepID=UPI002193EBAD|nr:heterokaryon incompatibility protein-domain-containing protein [Exophiala viscosa]
MEVREDMFRYRRLPPTYTRLFLVPPIQGGALRCRLFHLHLLECGTKMRYNALSYTWGDATETTTIRLLDDKTGHEGQLEITKSLEIALQRARHPTSAMLFWADQICIDQANLEEKETQIVFMKLIYERAGSIYAWLGPAADQSDIAMSLIGTMDWAQWLLKLEDPDETEAESEPSSTHSTDRLTPNSTISIIKLMRRPWWSRTWILQEATAQLPNQTMVCCGEKEVQLSKFADFIGVIRQTLLRPELVPAEVRQLYNLSFMAKFMAFRQKRNQAPQRPLLELVENARDTNATDARDKVYSMIGFAMDVRDIPGQTLRPSYSQPALAAYVEFSLWHIERHQCLDILSHCFFRGEPFAEAPAKPGRLLTVVGAQNVLPPEGEAGSRTESSFLPTWAPDWRQKSSIQVFPKLQDLDDLSSPALFCAATNQKTIFPSLKCDYQAVRGLRAHGVRVGYLCRVENKAMPRTTGLDVEDTWQPHDREKICPLTGLSMLTVFKRTMFADVKGYFGDKGQLAWRRSHAEEDILWPPVSILQHGPQYPDFVTLKRTAIGRCPFSLKPSHSASDGNNIWGLGPGWAQAGDEVWLLSGAKVPFVLRPRHQDVQRTLGGCILDLHTGIVKAYGPDAGQVAFEIVGECFILGLMDGELLGMMGPHPHRRERPPALKDLADDFSKLVIF